MPEYRPLEVTLISADGIKNVNMFKKMDVYAVAFIYGYPQTKKKKTAVDRNCGTSPRWNQKLHFTINERALSNPGLILVIQLKADKSFRPDIDIGHVAVPFPELIKNMKKSGEIVLEYQVRSCSGKSKGVLKFSYKFGDKLIYKHGEMMKGNKSVVTAYPPTRYRNGQAGAGVPAAGTVCPSHPGIGYQQPVPGRNPGYAHRSPPPSAQGYYGHYPPPSGSPQPGYRHAPPPAYGYQQPIQKPTKKKKTKNNMGTRLGLGAGLVGGMVIGDMASG